MGSRAHAGNIDIAAVLQQQQQASAVRANDMEIEFLSQIGNCLPMPPPKSEILLVDYFDCDCRCGGGGGGGSGESNRIACDLKCL